MITYLWPVIGYLIGSVPAAILVARAFGLDDPRTTGSRNPGATNMLRYGGKTAAAVTLALDVLKGVLVVVIARAITSDATLWAASGLAVFLGHLYPIYYRFRGGKGVATALGVWLALAPIIGSLLLVIWLAIAGLFRYSSVAALGAAAAAPLLTYWLAPAAPFLGLAVIMTVLLVWRHRSNIVHLLRGTEGRIGAKG